MKYILIAAFSLLHFSLFAQTSKIAVLYNSDSSIVGTGVLENKRQTGLWKFYNAKTNTLITGGNYKNGLRDGQWGSFHANGKPKELADYRDGKLFGPARFFDSNGLLIKEAIFQDSILVGKYTEYYGSTDNDFYTDPSQIKLEGNYVGGKKAGQWLSYFPGGELSIREFYVDGLREGPYFEFDPEGNVLAEATAIKGQFEGIYKTFSLPNMVYQSGAYKNGEKIGAWKSYFPGTKYLESEELYDSSSNRIGEWSYFYESGRLARKERYENNIAVGVWEEYFPDKTVSKRKTYVLGVPEGDYVEYHSSGKLSVQGQYEGGAKKGVWKTFYPDGQLYTIGEYRNDLKTGLWKFFNKIGVLIAEGEYLLGMENGQWVYYYDGAQLKSVGSFNLGFEDGIWGLFYDNKQLTQEEFWDNGRLLNVSDYNTQDGKETRDKGTLKDGKGTRITYYVTGQKESEGSYQGGKSEGLWIYYHESGRKASEGMMKDGKKQGPWKFYNTAGRLEDLLQFKDDEIQYPKGSTDN
jgi:antitoxin component YwqK of YwqJK toxin-antitoxin module